MAGVAAASPGIGGDGGGGTTCDGDAFGDVGAGVSKCCQGQVRQGLNKPEIGDPHPGLWVGFHREN